MDILLIHISAVRNFNDIQIYSICSWNAFWEHFSGDERTLRALIIHLQIFYMFRKKQTSGM